MKKHTLTARAAASVLALALGLTACGSSSSTSSAEESEETQEVSEESTSEETVEEAAAEEEAAEEETESAAESEEVEYKYGTIDLPVLDGSLCWSPAILAVELGYFAEEGFDVNLVTSSIEANKIALNEGSVPIILGDFQYFPSIEAGVDISVVAGMHKGCIKLVVLPDSEIESVEDLVGATIGVDEIGGTPYMAASLWLEQAGISADASDGQVTFLPYSDGNLELEALYSGEIDVAAVWDPYGTTSSNEGKTRVILDIGTDEPFAGKYCCFVYASNAMLEEDPDQVAAALRALNRAQEYVMENPEEAVEIVLETGYIQMDDVDLGVALLESYEFCSMEDTDGDEDTLSLEENVEYFAQALYDVGYLSTEPEEFLSIAYTAIDLGE